MKCGEQWMSSSIAKGPLGQAYSTPDNSLRLCAFVVPFKKLTAKTRRSCEKIGCASAYFIA
jgi:hypothetical protein